jgi:hypothetical protein
MAHAATYSTIASTRVRLSDGSLWSEYPVLGQPAGSCGPAIFRPNRLADEAAGHSLGFSLCAPFTAVGRPRRLGLPLRPCECYGTAHADPAANNRIEKARWHPRSSRC